MHASPLLNFHFSQSFRVPHTRSGWIISLNHFRHCLQRRTPFLTFFKFDTFLQPAFIFFNRLKVVIFNLSIISWKITSFHFPWTDVLLKNIPCCLALSSHHCCFVSPNNYVWRFLAWWYLCKRWVYVLFCLLCEVLKSFHSKLRLEF